MVGVSLDPVADLRRRLARKPPLRPAVHRWWNDHGLADHPQAVGKRVALALIEQPQSQLKLAGVVVFHELLADQLHAADLSAFARLFDAGHLADGDVVDWFAVKVLGALILRVRGRAAVVRAIAEWSAAETAWQRRAACIALAALAPQADAEVAQHVLSVCAAVVWSPDRIDQTAVGWVLRELSRAEPARVEAFVRRHARFMSRECARHAIEKLSPTVQRALLSHHRRATSLRR